MQLPPITVGGVGGSGTRLIAAIQQDVGFYLGGDLNRAFDNLWFTDNWVTASINRLKVRQL